CSNGRLSRDSLHCLTGVFFCLWAEKSHLGFTLAAISAHIYFLPIYVIRPALWVSPGLVR
ncbi:MAG: hypothetical protein WBW79_11880, partial [Desulfocapsaceae bacterium]